METVPEIKAWVEGAVGGRVVRLQTFQGGRSRAMYTVDVERGGEVMPLIVRQDTGLGPHSGTAFNLRRETAALRAVEAAEVKAPRVYALSEAGDAVIMQRLEGQAEMPADPELRRAAVEGFCEALAELHRADPDQVMLPAPKAKDAREGDLNDLADWRDGYRRLCEPHAVVDHGFDWLEANAQVTGLRTHVLHGDAGPGNFMHDRGALTGLVDWETAHYGDPHHDLAWIWFRTHFLKQDVEAESYLRTYLRISGFEFDPRRVVYYIAQIVMRCTVACGVRQSHEPAYASRAASLRELLEVSLADARNGRLTCVPPLPVL